MSYYTTLDFILETFPDHTFELPNGFNDAVIGIEGSSMRLIYSISKCVQILMDEGMSVQEAFEHLDYNVIGGYIGDNTPVWCDDYFNQ